jgi:hypothetical protein
LQELLTRLQDRHVDCAEAVAKKAAVDATSAATVNADTPNVLQSMMKLEKANARAKTANKVVLEEEKEKDTAEKAVEELKRQLQPKRARTDDDAGDAHDLLTEFDNCDLSDQGRFLASLPSWSGWVDFILVLWGLFCDSLHTGGVDQDAQSHGARQ